MTPTTSTAASITALSSTTDASLLSPSDRCPTCKATRYTNPTLRILVTRTCYHRLCESCIDRTFVHGGAHPCLTCKRLVKKKDFKVPTFEDVAVEREVDIRRRLAGIFNKTDEDFATQREYDDYLDMTEDIAMSLVKQRNVEDVELRIREYQSQHAVEIAQAAQRAMQSSQAVVAHERAEHDILQASAQARKLEVDMQREERRKLDQELLEELATAKDEDAARRIEERGKRREHEAEMRVRLRHPELKKLSSSALKSAGDAAEEEIVPSESPDVAARTFPTWTYPSLPVDSKLPAPCGVMEWEPENTDETIKMLHAAGWRHTMVRRRALEASMSMLDAMPPLLK